MIDRYILDKDHNPIRCEDLILWAYWYEDANRHVALDVLEYARVSTVFLGLDHNFLPAGPPVLFETMVFVDCEGNDCWRYCTWAEAAAGHARILADVKRIHEQTERAAGSILSRLRETHDD